VANAEGRDFASGSGGATVSMSGGGSGQGPAPSNVTSVSLLQQARAGDQAAWRQLFRLYTPLVCHWCRKRGVHGADVDDVLQEVFQTTANVLADFRRDRPGDTFRGWLHGITRHKVLAFQRRRGSQPQAEGGSEMGRRLEAQVDSDAGNASADSTDAGEQDDPKLLHDLFHTVVEMVRMEFEERTWVAFWRTVIDGQRPVDVAAELSISPAAVRMAKCRVVRRVREQLGDVSIDT
jgi:RNA polymerase sigma-70 factor (ECF subfamily)